MATIVIVSDLAKKTRGSIAAVANKTYTNRKSWVNECDYCELKSIDRAYAKAWSICNECRLRKKLL